jgi:redox-sensitive bicupin YhaK (pirin superfamily)
MVHSEMPADQGKSNGSQLWINLPKRLKQVDPEYQQVNAEEFQTKAIVGGQVKVLVGEGSPLKIKTEIIYQHVTLNKRAQYQLDLNAAMRGIVYVMSGKLSVNDESVKADQALFVEDIEHLEFLAEENSQFMICMGKPHGEPIRQHGPFVD